MKPYVLGDINACDGIQFVKNVIIQTYTIIVKVKENNKVK